MLPKWMILIVSRENITKNLLLQNQFSYFWILARLVKIIPRDIFNSNIVIQYQCVRNIWSTPIQLITCTLWIFLACSILYSPIVMPFIIHSLCNVIVVHVVMTTFPKIHNSKIKLRIIILSPRFSNELKFHSVLSRPIYAVVNTLVFLHCHHSLLFFWYHNPSHASGCMFFRHRYWNNICVDIFANDTSTVISNFPTRDTVVLFSCN